MVIRNYSEVVFNQLSIDEKSFRKSHYHITVCSHPSLGCVLYIGESRTKKDVKSLLNKSLTPTQLQQNNAVSMDIRPNASLAHDSFLQVKYLNKAIDKVRHRAVKHHQELKKSRYALLKNRANLTKKQRIHFDAMASANYEVGKA